MAKIIATFEIYDEDTNEVLVDNLTFEEAAEQSAVYMGFFGTGISVLIRETVRPVRKHVPRRQEFSDAWVNYLAELLAMGNL
jgi:hypothetical protein